MVVRKKSNMRTRTAKKLLRSFSIESKKRTIVWLLDRVEQSRSTTELNSDRHSQRCIVIDTTQDEPQSCGSAPSPKRRRFNLSSSFPQFANAGPAPAFSLRAASASLPARRAEFISVSGLRAERSALLSDQRLKRFSGVAAATVPPHAPMNSPVDRFPVRAGFILNYIP